MSDFDIRPSQKEYPFVVSVSHDVNHLENKQVALQELLQTVWAEKLKIIGMSSVLTVLVVFWAISLPNEYRAEALLKPNSNEQSSPLSSLAGQFGGLASLAGINLGGQSVDKVQYALEVIKSKKFLYQFIAENDLYVPLMAAKGWDLNSNKLIINEKTYDEISSVWIRDTHPPRTPKPSNFETYESFLKNNLSVSTDKNSGMVKISVTHYDPYFAKELVNKLVEAINLTIKNEDLIEANDSIKFLTKELENTDVSDMKSMFYTLIEQQQQTILLTNVRDDYVLKVVDPAIVPEEKAKPNRALICVLGAFLSGMISMLIVIIRSRKKLNIA